MKALVLSRYGSPFDLTLEERATPTPQADEVLVKVCATAVNDWDWCFVRGKPLLYRLMFGLRRPRVAVLGAEMAGIVAAVGDAVRAFRPGDQVYGDISAAGFGGFAEYACVPEHALVRKPAEMAFEEAASLPHAAMLALQGLTRFGRIREGNRVLINGGGGGVGAIALQIAKHHGAEVTGVDATAKLAAMKAFGFDHVVDYTRDDFTRMGRTYDVILDTRAKRSPWSVLRALKDGGRYVTVGGDLRRLLEVFAIGPILSKLSGKDVRILALRPNAGLDEINRLFQAGKLKCLIDGPYPLEEVPCAIQRFGEAQHLGKIVIRVA